MRDVKPSRHLRYHRPVDLRIGDWFLVVYRIATEDRRGRAGRNIIGDTHLGYYLLIGPWCMSAGHHH